jgi:hypothetical protein
MRLTAWWTRESTGMSGEKMRQAGRAMSTAR